MPMVVSRANQYARDRGIALFIIYQGRWNAAVRAVERDIAPMCPAEVMAMVVWGAMGSRAFKTDAARATASPR